MSLIRSRRLLAGIAGKKLRETGFSRSASDLSENEAKILAKGRALKRLNATKALLPLSFSLEGTMLQQHFTNYVTETALQSRATREWDAISFFRFLRACKSFSAADKFLFYVMKFEVTQLIADLDRRRFMIWWAPYDLRNATVANIGDQQRFRAFHFCLKCRTAFSGSWRTISFVFRGRLFAAA